MTRFHNKYFKISFWCTLIIILTIGFLVITDYTCKSDLFGYSTLPLTFSENGVITYANLDLFGVEKSIDVSGMANFIKALAEFICFPTK